MVTVLRLTGDMTWQSGANMNEGEEGGGSVKPMTGEGQQTKDTLFAPHAANQIVIALALLCTKYKKYQAKIFMTFEIWFTMNIY